MHAIVIIIMLVATVVAATAADDVAAGNKIYVSKCSRCHKFYDPSAYDDSQWELWMGKMRTKARLNDKQYEQLVAYLATVRPRPPKDK